MDYICLFLSYGQKFKKLTDAQFGQLVRAAMTYAETGERIELSHPTADAYLDVVVADIDEKADAQKANAEKRRQAALTRWNANDAPDAKDANADFAHIPNQTKPNQSINQDKPEKRKEEKEEKKSPTKSVFTPPTVEEVADYCKQRKNKVDPELFVAYYAKQGWKLTNGQTMKDWKSAVITWEKRDKERTPKSTAIPEPKKNGFLAMLEQWDKEHEGMF